MRGSSNEVWVPLNLHTSPAYFNIAYFDVVIGAFVRHSAMFYRGSVSNKCTLFHKAKLVPGFIGAILMSLEVFTAICLCSTAFL